MEITPPLLLRLLLLFQRALRMRSNVFAALSAAFV